MKTTSVISLLLALTILTGSVPYSYAYCMMMKRSVDSAMRLQCNAHRGDSQSSPTGTQSLDSAMSMMRLVSKSTTDSYEHRSVPVSVQAFTILMLDNLPAIQSNASTLPVRVEVESPPPDIVIEILNLRI
jgi:hypothetical protein